MNEDIKKNAFIPCGDSMEKMGGEILDDELDMVSGGVNVNENAMSKFKRCPKCMRSVPVLAVNGEEIYYCKMCGEYI
ncbi:MAG: hypothetical protein IJ466_05595 [Clostridia bacterium]|nr:hypothetical protein [Clostridia bacterium]